MGIVVDRLKKYGFLFEELVKRDFKKKYKRTALGILWSLLGPMLELLVMALIFGQIFGRDIPHFIVYLFAGRLVYGYFKESTGSGMRSLMENAGIIKKIKAPKYIFLLSKNVSSLINFLITLIIFFVFVAAEGISFSPRFILLLYPIICLMFFNIGVGLILSALHVFFKDVQYLYDIFTLLVMHASAIFWDVSIFSETMQRLFMLNPIFAYIHYIRLVVIGGMTPSFNVHLLCAAYALTVLVTGSVVYKKCNYRFVYYM